MDDVDVALLIRDILLALDLLVSERFTGEVAKSSALDSLMDIATNKACYMCKLFSTFKKRNPQLYYRIVAYKLSRGVKMIDRDLLVGDILRGLAAANIVISGPANVTYFRKTLLNIACGRPVVFSSCLALNRCIVKDFSIRARIDAYNMELQYANGEKPQC